LITMLYTSPWAGVEPTTSVAIGTDCIGSCKSNYHTIPGHDVPAVKIDKCIKSQVTRWFSPGILVSSTNKTCCHDITEILLKVALNTIKKNNLPLHEMQTILWCC
jgi:hypothetical protein